jgi:hypothetical protein
MKVDINKSLIKRRIQCFLSAAGITAQKNSCTAMRSTTVFKVDQT